MFKRFALGSILAAVAACSVVNNPINVASREANAPLVEGDLAALPDDSIYIGLAFSGGGTRASAFAYGMLKELELAGVSSKTPHGLLDHVRLVTGVSGGSVTAANFGLKGPRSMRGFEAYLKKNGEKYMANSLFNPLTIMRGLSGGANGRKTFGRFLDEELFKGATFGDLRRRSRIKTWINAADVANNTTFIFSPETFDALCSDLSSVPLSEAVSASAAFPLVFSPIVLEAHRSSCDYREPDWMTAARHNPEASSAMRAHARVLESYSDPEKVKFVKLLDGGITDNFGTTGLSVERARAQNPYGPLTAEEAVRLRRFLFLVSNAGVHSDQKWTQKIAGPGGPSLAMSIATSSMASATRTGYDLMRLALEDWERDLVEYRCSLSLSEVRRLRGTTRGWDCRDLKFFVGEVNATALDPDTQDSFNTIPTRLRLKPDQVDLAIDAARTATRRNAELRGFLRSIDAEIAVAGGAGQTPAPRLIQPRRN
ncbi:MAG: patatin-like phospholipase family protein [Brevirhabdus sp.]